MTWEANMRRLSFLFALLSFSLLVTPASLSAQTPLDLQEIQTLMADLDGALMALRADEMMALFTDDATVETRGCGKEPARQAVAEFAADVRSMQPVVESYRRSRSALQVLPVDGGEGAVVRSTVTEDIRAGEMRQSGASSEVTTLVRNGEGFRIRSIRAATLCS